MKNQSKLLSNKRELLMRTEISMILIIAVLFLVAAFGTPNFLSEYNLTNILKQSAIIGIISLAETCASSSPAALISAAAPSWAFPP